MFTEFWLASENLAFAVSGFLLIAVLIFQFFGLGEISGDIDADLDADLDADSSIGASGATDGLLSIIGVKRLPFMMWLALFLMTFTLIGFGGQQIFATLTSQLLPLILAAPAAGLVALPFTGFLAKPLARIIPRDETSAVSRDSLVGRFAQIEIGTAETGSPARAKVNDIYGHSHYVMVEPDNSGQRLETGEKLLLVRREKDIFKAISQGDNALPRL